MLAQTFQTSDSIDGRGGNDTFNLTVTADADLPAGVDVSSVEVVNLVSDGTGQVTNLDATSFAGAEQVWQVNDANDIAGVAEGQAAGFRDTAATATVTFTGESGVVALDNVDDGSALDVAGTSLTSVSISGSVDDDGATPAGPGSLTVTDSSTSGTGGAVGVTEVTGEFSSDVLLDISDFTAATSVDLSASTGAIGNAGTSTNVSLLTDLETFVSGSGNDNITAAISDEADTSFDLGEGNDTFTLNGTGDTNNTATSVTLGEGNDTFVVDTALTNVADVTDFAAGMITVEDFNASEDVIDVSALGGRDVLTNTEQANITAAADLEAALDLASTATTQGEYSVFDFGGDAYIFNEVAVGDTGFENGDGLIKLTGMSVADIDAGVNFLA
ncbi:hypothetical protein [Vreelandella gomseomensis]|uniref:Uncharacterized protein n=1 Tax=Vreelandella gomseomensis TaxID=370766 RepID=A0ABU1GFB6_9GAMM|nr:hypothetical protein [Halomonas gomseomensis]MDR5876012.1 hypothetical protein [Halomonas gomseomensis]